MSDFHSEYGSSILLLCSIGVQCGGFRTSDFGSEGIGSSPITPTYLNFNFMYKRFQYFSNSGISWTSWFECKYSDEKWQLKNKLLNEYKE